MERRNFIKSSLVAGAGIALASSSLSTLSSCTTCCKKNDTAATLKLSFQEGIAPQKSLNEKFDYMESLGVVGFEPGGWNLANRVEEIQTALSNRNIQVSAICAGFGGFILSEDPAQKEKFDVSYRQILEAAGALKSVGVIMVPAFNSQTPCKPHTQETRDFLVEQLHELGEFAVKCGTTVILEPLNRREAFYLRQVADAAAICRDAKSEGVKCMGDFWHMQEETSDYGAFMSAGKYLQHVHMASRGERKTPGEDGQLDNYVEGFRALKQMGYNNYVSFECGCKGDKLQALPAAVELLRSQWEQA